MKLSIILVIVALSGCSTTGKVFKERANRLQSWMNREQVVALLGSPDSKELRVCGIARRWQCLAWTYAVPERNAWGWRYTESHLQIFFRNAAQVAHGLSVRRVEPSIMVYREQHGPWWILEKWNWL